MNSKPREIMPWSQRQSVLLFTDGAVEDDFGSVTMVLCWLTCAVVSDVTWWSYTRILVNDWGSKGKKQVIAQAEIFPILVSRKPGQLSFIRGVFFGSQIMILLGWHLLFEIIHL